MCGEGSRGERPACHPERSERKRAESKDPVSPNGGRTAASTPTMRRANTYPAIHGKRARHSAQTVHPATARTQNCASGDNERPETAPGCRQMYSLSRGVSPDAQSDPLAVARCTVCARTVVRCAARARTPASHVTSHSRAERRRAESRDPLRAVWWEALAATPAPRGSRGGVFPPCDGCINSWCKHVVRARRTTMMGRAGFG